MKLRSLLIFFLIIAITGAVMLTTIAFTNRYSEAKIRQASEMQFKKERVRAIITNLQNTEYNARPRVVNEAYQLTINLADQGYLDQYSFDTAFEAVNYKVASCDKVISDFSHITVSNDEQNEMIQDMIRMLKK